MSNLTKLFDYQGNKVTFKKGNGVAFVHATQMAKPFGKKPANYLELPTTKDLIEACVRKSDTSKPLPDFLVMVHIFLGRALGSANSLVLSSY